MNKKEKRTFTAAAVCCIVLILGTLMGLAGTISSSGGFSLFAGISILNFLSLVYLAAALFRRKKDLHLGLALGANALVSLLTVCFFFAWQELLICITLTVLTVNFFLRKRGNSKWHLFTVSLPAAGILISTMISFAANMAQTENGQLIFDMSRWIYYFSPFVFALVYAVMADLTAAVIHDCPELKPECRINRFSLLPACLMVLAAVITLAAAARGTVVGNGTDSGFEFLLMASGIAACISAAVYPFLFSFLQRKEQNAPNHPGKETEQR